MQYSLSLDILGKNLHNSRMNNDFRSYIKGILIIFFCWFILGSTASRLAVSLIPESYSYRLFITMNIQSLFMFIGILLSLRYVLNWDLRSFISESRVFHHRESLAIAFLWLALFTVTTIIEGNLDPERILRGSDWITWMRFLPIVLLLTPIQTTAEELFFRTYLARWAQSAGMKSSLIIALSGIIFLAVHLLNPEIALYHSDPFIYIYYAVFGSCMMGIGLFDHSFEIPIIIHLMNNLFTLLIINYHGSVLTSPALFYAKDASPLASTISILIGSAGTCLLIRKPTDPHKTSR